MLSYDEALAKILQTATNPKIKSCPLTSSVGCCSAEEVFATLDHPPLPQSAMDGYAISKPTEETQTRFSIVGACYAGDAQPQHLQSGEAIKVATGAPVPPNSFAVVPIEECEDQNESLTVRSQPNPGKWIRIQGMDTSAGSKLLNAGDEITPGRLSNLAQQGLTEIKVFSAPRVAVLTSGDEVIEPGQPRLAHQIYNSNQTLVKTLLSQSQAELGECLHIPDTQSATQNALEVLSREHDLIITTGGASVGERDFLTDCLRQHGTLEFWKVKARPGKPVFTGHYNGAHVLGLPGNPVSTFVSFHLYGVPLIARLGGATSTPQKWTWVRWPSEAKPHPTRRDFLRASWSPTPNPEDLPYRLATGQTSGHTSDLLSTNLLIEIPSREELKAAPPQQVRAFFL